MKRWSRWLNPKADANQVAIVRTLRQAGCSVMSLGRLSQGAPDLLVARAGTLYLMEVKIPKERLNATQREWHRKWGSEVLILRSVEEAVQWLERP